MNELWMWITFYVMAGVFVSLFSSYLSWKHYKQNTKLWEQAEENLKMNREAHRRNMEEYELRRSAIITDDVKLREWIKQEIDRKIVEGAMQIIIAGDDILDEEEAHDCNKKDCEGCEYEDLCEDANENGGMQ